MGKWSLVTKSCYAKLDQYLNCNIELDPITEHEEDKEDDALLDKNLMYLGPGINDVFEPGGPIGGH